LAAALAGTFGIRDFCGPLLAHVFFAQTLVQIAYGAAIKLASALVI